MKRAWILLEDGKLHEVPIWLLDQEHTFWPPTLPIKNPAEPVRFVSTNDLYRRHEVIEGVAYVYLRDSEATSRVPSDVVDWIRRQTEQGGANDPSDR